MTPNLLPLPCPACGACAVPTIGPGAGQHVARAVCASCGRFLKWLPRALVEKESAMGGLSRAIVLGTVSKAGVEVRYSTSGIVLGPEHLPSREVGCGHVHREIRE